MKERTFRGPGGYFDAEETRALVRSIGAAEKKSRGELRLHVEQTCEGDALERAREVFGALGMQHTRDDTGVLLYVAVGARKAAVFAGAGVHGVAATGFWDEVIGEVARGFGGGDPVAGLCEAMGKIGNVLREHAPGDDDAGNELPNVVTTG